jgi:membrane-associated protease RseP (regulator of RpoE activity)
MRCVPPAVQEELVPVPTALFQGSLLLGSISRAVLGASAGSPTTLIHPALVAGWCGLVTTALNLLPVGNLDGGKMMQVLPLCRCEEHHVGSMPKVTC